MLRPQDFRDILVVSRQRSLKAAAAALDIDASTMGRRLEAIEARFGSALFRRGAQGIELTDDGTLVATAAEKMEAVELAFERDLVARERQRVNGVVVTSAEWGVSMLTPLLVALGREHPDVQPRLRIENRALDLTRREADIALRIGRPKEKSLVGRRVGVIAYGLYASSSYLAEHGAPRALDDLSRHAFCSFDQTFANTPHVRWQASVTSGARITYQTNSMLSLVEAVEAGAGIATLPRILADRRPALKRVLPDLAAIERDLWLVFHRDLRKSRSLRAAVDALLEKVKPLFSSTSQR
ncbi:Transcriptional regulator, LysR family [Labilithrix luteola]|uniref:Transcriptional regulator, LysR family n=1 Tax=Labilithrix luteola TaxID=1391654 RepID=A0A0K1QE71_9BACT|nr:LysR family transcriptional regulator [Labilithrix luteola]AKV03710.1 Transcriptional regulator, LysR family [Labilithrix luteola]